MSQGIVTSQSRYTFEETIAKLQSLLKEKGIKLFTIIDHSGEAASAGLAMPPTKVLVFGNPKRGNAAHARRARHRHRPAAQNPRC